MSTFIIFVLAVLGAVASESKEEKFYRQQEGLAANSNPLAFSFPRIHGTRPRRSYYFSGHVFGSRIDRRAFRLSKVEGNDTTAIDPNNGDVRFDVYYRTSPVSWYAPMAAEVRFAFLQPNCDMDGVYRLSHKNEFVDFRFVVEDCEHGVTEVVETVYTALTWRNRDLFVGVGVHSLDRGNELNLHDLKIAKEDSSTGEWAEFSAKQFSDINVRYTIRQEIRNGMSRIYGGIQSYHAVCQLNGNWKFTYGEHEAEFVIFVGGC